MKRAYRAWINQPSTLQPGHHLNGRVGIIVDDDGQDSLTMFFTDGDLVSTTVLRQWVSKIKLSSAEDF